MQAEFIAIICGLAAGFGWGFSGYFDARASKAIGPLSASFLINGLVAAGYAAVYLLLFRHHYTWDALGVIYAIGSGMVITIGALTYFKGLAIGPVSLVSPLSASYPLITTLVALGIFHARPSAVQLLAILLIMVGVMGATGLIGARDVRHRAIQRGPVLGLSTAVAWGLGYALAAQAIQRLGWQFASLIEFSAMALAFGIFIPLAMPNHGLTPKVLAQGIRNKFVLLSGSISLFAALALNVGLSREHSSGAIVATLSACYPVLTVILARRSFNEEVGLIPTIGAFVSISGVLLLSASVQ